MSSAKSRSKKLRGAGFDQLFSVRTIAGLASTTNASMRQTIVTNGYENAFNIIGILPPNNGQPLKRPAQVAIINAIHLIALYEVNNGQMSQQQANMLPPITPIDPAAVAAFAQNYVNTMPQENENENENDGQGKKRVPGQGTMRGSGEWKSLAESLHQFLSAEEIKALKEKIANIKTSKPDERFEQKKQAILAALPKSAKELKKEIEAVTNKMEVDTIVRRLHPTLGGSKCPKCGLRK